ncbi:MAG TPA: gluconeogenesis factor YvcK family protein [Candidatus Saccharimonadales bacterium]|nr:gluconeogenesis factor YvcK family protein [Candidatus Saccharimonadales bacterium]
MSTVVKGVKIVVIGGGTGSFVLLDSLKNYVQDLAALVNMADDGGSTGVLRDELGVLPPGDVRQCLVALSKSSLTMRNLFNYRFPTGSFAEGHSFGNLFLTAVEKMTDNFAEAVDLASQVLNITGQVIPITNEKVKLVMKLGDGRVVKGQSAVDETDFKGSVKPSMSLEPHAEINPAARKAILEAGMVVFAPGDLYGSLAPALVVKGVAEAVKESRAKKVYVSNLVTQAGQTDGFMVHDFADEIERFLGVGDVLDYVLYNTQKPSPERLHAYLREGESAVGSDKVAFGEARYKPVGAKLVSSATPHQNPSDKLRRSFIRHNGDRTARQLLRIYLNDD